MQEIRLVLVEASTVSKGQLRMSLTPAALRASQRLAAHAASTARPPCPSTAAQQSSEPQITVQEQL